jgi:hypothetical protein
MSQQTASSASRATRIALLAWGITCYVIFFACFLYAIAFLGDFEIAPKTINSEDHGPVGLAVAVNLDTRRVIG